MTKAIAQIALLCSGLAVMLGNYWFTFGLWPKSWFSFVAFGIAAIALALMNEAVKGEK